MSFVQIDFVKFFQIALNSDSAKPYPYQIDLAQRPAGSAILDVPTGTGKTAAAILSWLYRCHVDPPHTPRRLVYCLPMHVLVEQTRDNARQWVEKLKERLPSLAEIEVYTLMGGEADEEWDIWPEKRAILIGTQDMLLSRALNRGYAMSRYRWPIHFGLLNNDCLWVCDEVQLMGTGLTTTTQLDGFRQRLGTIGSCPTLWMSATVDLGTLSTVDCSPDVAKTVPFGLGEHDLADPRIARRINATKKLRRAPVECRTPEGLAAFVAGKHALGSQTLVVVNRVERAKEVYNALRRLHQPTARKSRAGTGCSTEEGDRTPELLLLHSRFRAADRRLWLKTLAGNPPPAGRIVVSTQVVEAGVDVTSALLVTDLAPFSSMVQRFGRCNRNGESAEANIFWVDRPVTQRDAKLAAKDDPTPPEWATIARPYLAEDLEQARDILDRLESAAPSQLPRATQDSSSSHVLRFRDLVDLFDTTRDLSGYDVDVSRFVRGGVERDVYVAWRPLGDAGPVRDTPAIAGDELCPVPIYEFEAFLAKAGKGRSPRFAWTWDGLEKRWEKLGANDGERLRPGMTLLLDVSCGGYDPLRGWDSESTTLVSAVPTSTDGEGVEGLDDDLLTFRSYNQGLVAHSEEVASMAREIVDALSNLQLDDAREDLVAAALRHDLGKAHPVFQATVKRAASPETGIESPLLAKSARRSQHERPHFRHELASALALLQLGASDLTVYLVACHHGKVRLSIRALPGELNPDEPGVMFARGIYDGDTLLAVQLGPGHVPESLKLSLEPMLLGRVTDGCPSWLERMVKLRDRLGVFRLAYMESLIRAADERASATPKEVL